jgi:hypothetical protein
MSMEHWWIGTERVKQKYWRKGSPSATLSAPNRAWTGKSNPDVDSDRPTSYSSPDP